MARQKQKVQEDTEDYSDDTELREAYAQTGKRYSASQKKVSAVGGIHVTPPKIPGHIHQLLVGPFTVRICRKKDFTLFVCSVLGVTITSQISFPSFEQLADDLSKATSGNKLTQVQVEKLWKGVIECSSN